MRFLILTIALAGCFQGPDRAPVVLGAKRGDAALAERVAKKIESANCRVVRRFDLASSIDADRAMDAGAIDAYLESERTALIDVLKLPVSQAVSIEQTVRPVYVNRGMLWSPPLGRGDLAVVFRKDIDRKCREATRALMRVAYIADAK
jgi:glycine betaine/choline ABC-type transport system substrate-binding protein